MAPRMVENRSVAATWSGEWREEWREMKDISITFSVGGSERGCWTCRVVMQMDECGVCDC